MPLHNGDLLRFSWHALRGFPSLTLLMLTAMAIGVAAVVLLTSLGEGARRYVTGEFASLGSNLGTSGPSPEVPRPPPLDQFWLFSQLPMTAYLKSCPPRQRAAPYRP